jgi:hypothetical protein
MNEELKDLLKDMAGEVDTLFGCDILHEDTSANLFEILKQTNELLKEIEKAEL